MISMTNWTYIIKTLFKSKKKQSEIRSIIINQCLLSKQKNIMGGYCVDDDMVWSKVLLNDQQCLAKMKELNINDIAGVYSYFEEIRYKKMRDTFPRKKHKKG